MFALSLLALRAACGDKTGTVPAPTPTPQAVTMKPQELVVSLGEVPLQGFKVTEDVSEDKGEV